MKHLTIKNFAQILEKAEIQLGNLTIFIGPQASGKTLVLELIKLIEDKGEIIATLKRYGFEISKKEKGNFLFLYFGEGMETIIRENTEILVDGKPFRIKPLKKTKNKEKVFYIPAQRVLTLKDGWPRPFNDYAWGDPYVVRKFSENLRRLMESGLGRTGTIFPQERKLRKGLRNLINSSLFRGAELHRVVHMRKRIVLRVNEIDLPFMVWSAGQREFVPLLLGLYWLMPSGKKSRREGFKTVIIEEPEMGLHPRAIETVILLILDLIQRGYRVIISTHSTLFLDVLMAITLIKERTRDIQKAIKAMEEIFDIQRENLGYLFEKIFSSKFNFKVYFFEIDKKTGYTNVKDITDLTDFEREEVMDWGGFLSFGNRINRVIAEI